MSGKSIRGARATVVDEPDVRAIRKAADISQSQFASLVGVNLRTLQNGEQRRTRPTGPHAPKDRGVQSEVGARGFARVEGSERAVGVAAAPLPASTLKPA
jgi:hypothetical protein